MTSESEREQALRRLLADAVEPVEPAPGAQTRLLARARAQRKRRQRPLMARWAPAALATLAVIVGVTVVFAVRGANDAKGSSTASSAAGAPSRAAESSSGAATSGGGGLASPQAPVPSSRALSSQKEAVGTAADGTQYSGAAPQTAALVPSDLDGDGRPDTFTLGAGTLAAQLSRYGLEAVSLPPLGAGARVLGVTTLNDAGGHSVPVLFVRLRQVGATATDTVVSLVDGRLTVLRQGSGPVLLTIDASHGYACNQGTLVASGSATPFVVDGAHLVVSAAVRAAAAAPSTSTGCF